MVLTLIVDASYLGSQMMDKQGRRVGLEGDFFTSLEGNIVTFSSL
jgi:hypothetical protein